jgi:hypothetical protein
MNRIGIPRHKFPIFFWLNGGNTRRRRKKKEGETELFLLKVHSLSFRMSKAE